MGTIVTAISDVTSVVTSIFTVMTGNAYCLFLLAASAVGVGIVVFRKIKGAAR